MGKNLGYLNNVQEIANLKETADVLREFTTELRNSRSTITEDEFRNKWLRYFMTPEGGLFNHWVNDVAVNPNLPVDITDNNGKVVCTVPPLFAPMGSTLTKTGGGINLPRVLAEVKARGDVRPTQKEVILVDALSPFIERVGTDPQWAKVWVEFCVYFDINDINKTTEIKAAEQIQETEDDYDDFEEI